jgi:hypothetical protein
MRVDAAAYCLLDLNDLWGNFCRHLTLDLACGKAVMSDGMLSVPYKGPTSLPGVLAAICNKRGYEPRWHDANDTVKALQRFPSGETSAVVAAISSKASPAPELNTTRNYFAHRRSDCRDKLGATSFYDTGMDYCAFKIGNFLRHDGRPVIDYWIDELRLSTLACM